MRSNLIRGPVLFGVFASSMAFADCNALITDALNWAKQPSPHTAYFVDYKLVAVTDPVSNAEYSAGEMTANGNLLQNGFSANNSGRTFNSSATWCPELGGGLCTGYQPFNYKVTAQTTFQLAAPNSLIIRNGAVAQTVSLSCTGNFLYGVLEGRRLPGRAPVSTFFTVDIHKNSREIPR